MKVIASSQTCHYFTEVGIFLIMIALVVALTGCGEGEGGDDHYDLTIVSTVGGSVIEPGEGTFGYDAGTTVTIVAEPDEHYHFASWTGDVDTIGNITAAATSIIIYDSCYSVTANFELNPGWCSLTVSSGGGSVTTPGEGVFVYAVNTTVDLVAESNEGYPFLKWAGDIDTIADIRATVTNVTMYDSYSITAQFGVEVWDWHDLNAIRDNPDSRYYLMNDLDSAAAGYDELAGPTANDGKGWQPTGRYAFNDTCVGILDGQGYEICDLFINRPSEDLVALFGYVGCGAAIKNIGVVNADVIGDYDVAGLVGENWGTVSHCYFTGSVTGNDSVGGAVGYNFGIVTNSYSTSIVTGAEGCAGGLVGANEGNVIYSYSTGSVAGTNAVGGLVGADWYGGVTACYATGSVTGTEFVGGLVGIIQGSYVTDSYSSGTVTGEEDAGGLVGHRWETAMSNSFWDIQTSGQATSDGGIGKTTVKMQDITTFTGATWNIVAVANPDTRNTSYIWNIVDAVTYPFLSWQS